MLGSKTHIKSKELMLLIAYRLGNKSNYGATVLNKALYFIDNINYLKTGRPISELKYIKQEHGPTPDPSIFLSLREEMISANDVDIVTVEFFGRNQKKMLAKREPNMSLFDSEEIEIIDQLLSEISDKNATEISDIAHTYPAWIAASDKEPLPFYTFLLSSKTPTEGDIEWAKSQMPECTA